MSKIWDALREAQRLKKQLADKQGLQNSGEAIPERRSTRRFFANTPVLVYGYGATDDPFHERTKALSVNAGGGLITLTTAVSPGQALLLINEVNLKEEECTVVREVSSYLIGLTSSLSFRNLYPIFGKRLAPEYSRPSWLED
jgi:hypothetical protein